MWRRTGPRNRRGTAKARGHKPLPATLDGEALCASAETPQAPTGPVKTVVEKPAKAVTETTAQAIETVRSVSAPVTGAVPALGVELP